MDNRIEEVIKALAEKRFVSPRPENNLTRAREWVRQHQKEVDIICQLFPQPLEKRELKDQILEILGYHGVTDTEGFLMSIIRKPQPLADKKLREELNNYFANDYYGMAYKDLREDLRHMVDMVTGSVLALLQPKIEEAKEQERERISKEVGDLLIQRKEAEVILGEIDDYFEGQRRQALKGGKHQQNKSIFSTRCSPF